MSNILDGILVLNFFTISPDAVRIQNSIDEHFFGL